MITTVITVLFLLYSMQQTAVLLKLVSMLENQYK